MSRISLRVRTSSFQNDVFAGEKKKSRAQNCRIRPDANSPPNGARYLLAEKHANCALGAQRDVPHASRDQRGVSAVDFRKLADFGIRENKTVARYCRVSPRAISMQITSIPRGGSRGDPRRSPAIKRMSLSDREEGCFGDDESQFAAARQPSSWRAFSKRSRRTRTILHSFLDVPPTLQYSTYTCIWDTKRNRMREKYGAFGIRRCTLYPVRY